MRPRWRDAIEFPANPFVALADFLIVLLMVLLLALLHQSVSSSRLLERMAVADVQKRLLMQASQQTDEFRADTALWEAYQRKEFRQTYVDGDLQRFRFDGSLFFEAGQSEIRSPRARRILAAFGQVLARSQGQLFDPSTRLYKRILVQGNADPSEGDEATLWRLSLERAQAAVLVLQKSGKLSPLLLEATGRGAWDPAVLPSSNPSAAQKRQNAVRNRRLEIIIVYSGRRALEYLSKNPRAASASVQVEGRAPDERR